jgi:hypothetical protein
MVSSDGRRKLGAITRNVALFIVAAPYAAFAQFDSPQTTEDAVQELVDEIGEIQSLDSNSPDLIEPLNALSLIYEERGDSELALALIARATEVIKVNHGLHTLDEAQLMRRSIRIERARGNSEVAWNEEQELLTLIRRHPNDEGTIPIFEEVADGRMAVLARYEGGEFPPEIELGCYYTEWVYDPSGWRRSGCRSGNRRTVVGALRTEADAYRKEAADIALRRARWVHAPCARPEAPDVADESRPRRGAEAEMMEAYLRALSDYVSCMEVKHEHAERTNASPEVLTQLAAETSVAADELATRTASYERRFGPIKTAYTCPGTISPPPMLKSIDDLACVHSGSPPPEDPSLPSPQLRGASPR